MQWLAEICVRRPVFAAMLTLAFIVAGGAAYTRLGIDRFPKVDFPTITVRTILPNAAAAEVETEVTKPLEDAVATVEGIDELRGISSDGSSLLLITFSLHRNLDAAAQDVRDAIGSVLNRLPPDVYPPVVRKTDTDSSPIMTIAVSGPPERYSSRALYLLADRYVKEIIESVQGVGQVSIFGATDRAIKVDVDARKLYAHNLSISQVRDALIKQNAEGLGGRVEAGHRELNLRTLGRFPNPQDFPNLTIDTINGRPIRLRDVATVTDGQKEMRASARLNSQPAVVVQVQRQSGANTVEVIKAVKQVMKRSQALMPEDVQLEVIQDQSRYIEAALHEIRMHLIMGSILASVVVLLFMRNWRSTFIAAVAIPASIIAAFAMMRLLDFTLNNITMLALVLMVGVVIDDAIVVLENVYHCIEEKGLAPVEAAIQGTKEIGLAVLATTLSLVVVFLPVSFLSSVTGRFLYQFGITASMAVMVSLLVSFTLTPMMCSRMLKKVKQGTGMAASRRGFYRWLDVSYAACLRWALRHRWLVAGLAMLVILANVPLYYLVRQDYVPTNVDESEFEVSITASESISVSAMDRTMQAVEEQIREVRGVVHTLTTMGSSGLGRVNSARVYVRIEDIETRTFSLSRLLRETLRLRPWRAFEGNYSQRDVMTAIRRRLRQPPFDRLAISVRNQTSLRQGAPVDIDFVLSGPDLMPLAQLSEKLMEKARNIPGLVDLDTTLRLDRQELVGIIDRERASALGVDAREIGVSLRLMVGGDDRVSRYWDAKLGDVYDVELRLVGDDRGSKAAISQLYVKSGYTPLARSGELLAANDPSPSSRLIRLDNVMDFEEHFAPARIDRLDRQCMVALRANIGPGYALADRIQALREAAAEIGLPPGYNVRVLGRGRELERTFHDFVWAFVLSLIFMYIILAAQFEHLVHPLTILISLPLAVPFGLFSLWLGGETLNLYSALGILVLFGVVKKNSILQVDHTNQLREAGLDRYSALVQANRDRLRPILMTTLSFVAGMLPLVIGTGPGAEERRSIAVLVLGGQTLSLLLTLLATPVVYTIFDDLGTSWRRHRHGVPEKGLVEASALPAPATTNGPPAPTSPASAPGKMQP